MFRTIILSKGNAIHRRGKWKLSLALNVYGYSALSIYRGNFSSYMYNSRKTPHISPARARYGVSFVTANLIEMLWLQYTNFTNPTIHQSLSHNVPLCNRNVHISVTKWCIVGYSSDALWDLWDGSIIYNRDISRACSISYYSVPHYWYDSLPVLAWYIQMYV